jgi:hypothetical protein
MELEASDCGGDQTFAKRRDDVASVENKIDRYLKLLRLPDSEAASEQCR